VESYEPQGIRSLGGAAAAVGEPATIAASIPDLLVHHSNLASVRAAIDGRSVP